jgi:hypothetical protein
LIISLIWDKRAIPLYWELLPKQGNSNFQKQTAAISKVLPVFKDYKIIVLGDRELCSVQLGGWLLEQNVYFCLRLKHNEFVLLEDEVWLQLNALGLSPGIMFYLNGVRVTKQKGFGKFNLTAKWKRKYLGWAPDEGWFILTNLSDLPTAISAYKNRFDIEEMFRDFKSGGYNMEDTNVSGNRLISLILIIAFAYSWTTFTREKIKKKGVQKYVARVKEYGRVQRRHSSFYVGLYGQNWVSFMDDCWGIVQGLMRLNCNKLEYYLRGLRAMELILSTF